MANTNPMMMQQTGQPYVGQQAIAPIASNVAGMPNSPGYVQNYNPNTMAMLPGYEAKQNQVNQDGFNQFKSQALRSGPSAWATLAKQQENQTMNTARDQAQEGAAGQTANTEAALASSGGLSSGARERAVEGGQKNIMSADQGLARQNMQNQSQVATNDEQNRMQMLSQLPGMEQNQLNSYENVAKGDQSNLIAEDQAQNAYNTGIYNTQAQGAAAGMTANAQEDAANAAANAPSLSNGFGLFKPGSGQTNTEKNLNNPALAIGTLGVAPAISAIGSYTGWF